MTTITFQLPDAMAERLRLLADAEGEDMHSYALEQFQYLLEADEADTVLGIRQGLAELDSEEGQPLEEFHAEMMAELAARKVMTQKEGRKIQDKE